MSEPFLGELKVFSFNFPPKGWAFCAGALLPINQNQALFSLLGTTYGGDGRVTFGLPDLQGRVPIHQGNGIVQGQFGGEVNHTLTLQEMAAHTHVPVGSSATANLTSASGNLWGAAGADPYNSTPNGSMNAAAITNIVGGGQPHNNLPPYLVLNVCIALVGIFPSRN